MKKAKQLTVKALTNGGLNVADRPQDIADSESPDMLNFWSKDGQLRLRPGLRRQIEQSYGEIKDVYPRDGHSILIKKVIKNGKVTQEKYGIYIAAEHAVFCYDGNKAEQISRALRYESGWVKDYCDYNFSNCLFIPSGSACDSSFSDNGRTWTANGEKIYLIGSDYYLEIKPQVIVYENPTGNAHITVDTLITPVVPYVPVLYTDCTPAGKGKKADEHNIISNKCIQKFTTDAKSNLYSLCDNNLDNKQVTAVYCADSDSKYIFSFPPDTAAANFNGIIAYLDREKGTIYFDSVLADAASLNISNNLVVTYSKNFYDKNPVRNCAIGTWYDGGTQTNAGFSRLFLSGFKGIPNRIYYSCANNPLYFPENSYIDVGAPADSITAFGIQYDILAIFKNNSIYSLSYCGATDSTAFTVKEIHSSVGCDMPASLKLASNVLIWGSSNKGIYALKSTSIKDERAVQLLSRKINKKLLDIPAESLRRAAAVCYGSSYYLFAADNVFILNYDSLKLSGEQSSKNEAWFVWKLPETFTYAFMCDSYLTASTQDGTVYLFDDTQGTDCGKYFDAYWYSKKLDFGFPDMLKKLYRFTLCFGCSQPENLEICFCDGSGESRHIETIGNGSECEKTVCVRPAARWAENAYIGVRRTENAVSPFSIIGYTANAVCGAQTG